MVNIKGPSYLKQRTLNFVYEAETDHIFSFSIGHGYALVGVKYIYG